MSDHPPRTSTRTYLNGFLTATAGGAWLIALLVWPKAQGGVPWWVLAAGPILIYITHRILRRPPAPAPAPSSLRPPEYAIIKPSSPVPPKKALYEILKTEPNNPAILLKLARLERKDGKRNKGEKCYRKCIHALWALGEHGVAAVVFEEFFINYGKVFCGPIQIRLARELARAGRHEMAALSLEAFIRGVEVCPSLAKEPLLMPEAYVALGRIMADKLGRPEAARRVFYEFLVRYPFAGQRDLVVNKLRLMTSARM